MAAHVEAASEYTGLDADEAKEGVEPLQTKAALRAAVAVKLHNPAAEEGDEPFQRADGILQIRKVDFEFLESDKVLVNVRPLLTPLPKTALCRSVLCASYQHRGLCDCRPPR